jgi:hypothetical protein
MLSSAFSPASNPIVMPSSNSPTKLCIMLRLEPVEVTVQSEPRAR